MLPSIVRRRDTRSWRDAERGSGDRRRDPRSCWDAKRGSGDKRRDPRSCRDAACTRASLVSVTYSRWCFPPKPPETGAYCQLLCMYSEQS